ncbi:MAG TPA: hypothetical protein PLL78_01405 [Fimbriimonadaceae bacterium]|nr:hypothetical protein [Fimbriimonadaceae bacterium]HRJ95317.1 hypothetical protein [Fimbriimonadaceae bacterium]
MPDTLGEATRLVGELERFIDAAVAANGGRTEAERPAHRIPFHWPPHPVAPAYHVLESDWTGQAEVVIDDTRYSVRTARTPYGVFGRCESLWVDARADSQHEMLRELTRRAEPLIARQRIIGSTLGINGRYERSIGDLEPIGVMKLLYCPDRDVANEARLEIETRASSGLFGPALVAILQDRRHPHRRIAQWCVLDLLEDIGSFFPDAKSQTEAIAAIRDLIWSAEDDYARTVYKAGVVLGGHVSTEPAAEALIECFEAPSRIGRRSAIHASFHLAEWLPERRSQILTALSKRAESDPEPLLKDFAAGIARDIEGGEVDHVMEPVFENE